MAAFLLSVYSRIKYVNNIFKVSVSVRCTINFLRVEKYGFGY